MRKTAYNKLKKVLLSDAQTWIERDGDTVLLTEGHLVVEIPYTDYKTFFVGDVFPALLKNDSVCRNNVLMKGETGHGFALCENPVIKSRYKSACEYLFNSYDDISATVIGEYKYIGDKGKYKSLVYIDTKHDWVLINPKFYNAVMPFMGKDVITYGSNRRSPVYMECGDKCALIFPIHYTEIENSIDIEQPAA